MSTITVEQFGQMRFADTEDYELVNGEPIPLSSGTFRHAKIRARIARLLMSYFEGHAIGEVFGEVDSRVTHKKIRRPGLSVFLNERLHHQIDLDKIPAPFAPDIASEILSPSDGTMEIRGKVLEYLGAGGAEAWRLDPSNGEIQVHTRGAIRILEGAAALEAPVLPGFSVRVADLGL